MRIAERSVVNSVSLLLLAGSSGSRRQAPAPKEPQPSAPSAATAEPAPSATAGRATSPRSSPAATARRRAARATRLAVPPSPGLLRVQPTHAMVELWPGGGWYTEGWHTAAPRRGQLGRRRADRQLSATLQGLPRRAARPLRPSAARRGDTAANAAARPRRLGQHRAHLPQPAWLGRQRLCRRGARRDRSACSSRWCVRRRRSSRRARPPPEQTRKNGYVPEDIAIQLATAASFVLISVRGRRQPKDTKDHPRASGRCRRAAPRRRRPRQVARDWRERPLHASLPLRA